MTEELTPDEAIALADSVYKEIKDMEKAQKYEWPDYKEEPHREWFDEACAVLSDMVGDKRDAYGDNLIDTGNLLRTFYPEGIPPEAYEEALVLVRLLDKLKRVANKHRGLNQNDQEDPWLDVAGYAIAIGFDLKRLERRKDAEGDV